MNDQPLELGKDLPDVSLRDEGDRVHQQLAHLFRSDVLRENSGEVGRPKPAYAQLIEVGASP